MATPGFVSTISRQGCRENPGAPITLKVTGLYPTTGTHRLRSEVTHGLQLHS